MIINRSINSAKLPEPRLVVGKLQQEIGAHRLSPRMRARKTRFSLFDDDIDTSLKQQCSSATLDRDSPLVKIRRRFEPVLESSRE